MRDPQNETDFVHGEDDPRIDREIAAREGDFDDGESDAACDAYEAWLGGDR